MSVHKGRGGARPGSGRKATGRKRLTVTLHGDLAERVRAVGKPAAFVREAVKTALRLPCEMCQRPTMRRLDGHVLCGFCGGS